MSLINKTNVEQMLQDLLEITLSINYKCRPIVIANG